MHTVKTFLLQYWSLIAFLVTAALSIGYWLRSRVNFRRQKFYTEMSFSINTIRGNALTYATLLEGETRTFMMNNDLLAKIVFRAAQKTTETNPFLEFPSETERWLVYNEIENSIYSLFYQGYIAEDFGLPTKTTYYFVALTKEQGHERMPLEKIRVILVRQEILDELAQRKAEIKAKDEYHEHRLVTLLAMRERLLQNPKAFPKIDVTIRQ